MRRLVVLDIVVGVCCILQFMRGVSPAMHVPVLCAQIILLAYGLYLLARRGQLTLARWDE